MKRVIVSAVFVVVALVGAATARAAEQNNPSPYLHSVTELVLNDGSRLYGVVESLTQTEIVFKTTSGAVVTAPRDRIISLRPVVGRIRNGEFRREDPNNSRLLFGPTGRTLAKGQTYLGVYEFLMPFVQVGITDYISVGGGTPLVFGMGESNRPWWVTPKVKLLSTHGTHVSAGLFHGFNLDGDSFGVAYAVVTKDVSEGSFTVGAGTGYTSEGDRGPVMMVGGDAPVRRNMKIVTENYLFRWGGLASAGIRFFGENLSADLAVGVIIGEGGETFGAPIVNFAYRF